MMVLIQMDFPLHPKRTPWKFSRFQAVHLADPRWAKFPFWHPFNMIFFHNLGPGSSKKAEIRVELQLQHEAHSSAFFVVKDLDLCIWFLITGIDPSLHFPTKKNSPHFFLYSKNGWSESPGFNPKKHTKKSQQTSCDVCDTVFECRGVSLSVSTLNRIPPRGCEMYKNFINFSRFAPAISCFDPIRSDGWWMDGWSRGVVGTPQKMGQNSHQHEFCMVQILQWFSNEGFDFWLARCLLALKNPASKVTLRRLFGNFIRMDPSERATGKKKRHLFSVSFCF